MLQFPTDSFYKFFAISGVAILISVLYGSILLIQESTSVAHNTYDDIELSNLNHRKFSAKDKVNDMEIEIIQLQNTLKLYASGIGTKQEPDHVRQSIISSRSEEVEMARARFGQTKADYNEIVKEIESLKKNKAAPSSVEILLEHKNRVLIFSYILTAIGAFMSVSGFSGWYRHHQSPADKILALQLKKESLEIEKLDIEIENLLNT